MTWRLTRTPGGTGVFSAPSCSRSVFSYAFAVPFIVERITWDPESSARELCRSPEDPGIGIVIQVEPGGKLYCKLLLRRILSFWSIYSLVFLPVAAPIAALRYVMRRAVDAERTSSDLRRRDNIFRAVGVSMLFVYAAVGVSRYIADLSRWF